MIRLGFINLKVVNVMLGCLIVMVGLFYLIEINSLAAKGYQIKELEQTVAKLRQTNSDLEFEALNLQSMGRIKDRVADLGMVAVGETEYLTPTPVAVAR